MDRTQIVYLILAVTISYYMFFILTPWVFAELNEYRQKYSTKTFSEKLSVDLIEGVCDFGNKNTINCSNKGSKNYVELPESMNKKEGVEFSYTFWIKLDEPERNNILFTRGIFPVVNSLNDKFASAKEYTVDGDYVSSEHTKVNEDPNDGLNFEQLVKCPMVRISNEKLTVTFNTLRKIHNTIEYDFKNHGILNSTDSNPRWFMFSIIFKEASFKGEYGLDTKGIITDLYINEEHVKSKFVENDSIKLNNGDLYTFPEGEKEVSGNKMGNLVYYNYALEPNDVVNTWKKGVKLGNGCAVGTKFKPEVVTSTNRLGKHGAQLFF